MVTKSKDTKVKAKAPRYPITQLLITSAWQKTYSTGSTGFFGRGTDPQTGKEYQIVGAVELKRN